MRRGHKSQDYQSQYSQYELGRNFGAINQGSQIDELTESLIDEDDQRANEEKEMLLEQESFTAHKAKQRAS